MSDCYGFMNLRSNATKTAINRAAYMSGSDKPINQAHQLMVMRRWLMCFLMGLSLYKLISKKGFFI